MVEDVITFVFAVYVAAEPVTSHSPTTFSFTSTCICGYTLKSVVPQAFTLIVVGAVGRFKTYTLPEHSIDAPAPWGTLHWSFPPQFTYETLEAFRGWATP